MDLFINYLSQVALTVGMIVLFGLLIALCRRGFCRIVGYYGPKILLATGVIGTPIHELSHALMCLLFGHRIVEIKLYQPNSEDGVLGYVQHSFNTRNLYHQIGNFFIGIAPILCGSGVLFLLLFLLVPTAFEGVMAELGTVRTLTANPSLGGYCGLFWGIITSIFHLSYAGDYRWWIFVVLALLIASHMELSGADIASGAKGFVFLALLWLLVDTVVFFISVPALETMTAAMASFGLAVAGFLALSGIFSCVLVILALLLKALFRVFGRR